mmetsp:Transcript_18876/g.27151  ORF Transcript_18876/g.27151 Transcript_18876/m.27151 type:complete len:157 (+) Transcript_18876:633-1103(+)
MDFPRIDGTPCFRYSKPTKPRRNVTFGKVCRREYSITFGDNPSCEDTMPICLDWCHTEEKVWNLDDFENVKLMFPPETQSSKTKHQRQPNIDGPTTVWRLCRQARYELLIGVGGYTRSAIIDLENHLFDTTTRETQTEKTRTLRSVFSRKREPNHK